VSGRAPAPDWAPLPPWQEAAVALGAAAAATAIAAAAGDLISESDVIMLYVAAVTMAAFRVRLVAGLGCAALSALAFNFFFIRPRFTLYVDDSRYWITFGMIGLIGILVSGLAARLRRQAEVVAAQLVQRQQLESQAEATRRAMEAERARSTLLSSVSHDLRTPLATITGATTTLLSSGAQLDEHTRRELLRRACGEAERLGHLLDNVLRMTRLEGDHLRPALEWELPADIAASAIGRLAPLAHPRTIRAALPAGPVLALVDAVLVEQLILNYLENAIKHAHGDEPIELSLRERAAGAELVIEVADRGPGLPPEGAARLFEKFVRGPTSAGSGLGLAICQAIAKLHGGRVWAGDRPGGGAIFGVALPRGGPAGVEVPDVEALLNPQERP
jgi:K+-sensing histidine kinase KdpD